MQKRRIYDITNVLEGIGLIKKGGKNHIRWTEPQLRNGNKYSCSGRKKEGLSDGSSEGFNMNLGSAKKQKQGGRLSQEEERLKNIPEELKMSYISALEKHTMYESMEKKLDRLINQLEQDKI